MGVQIFGQKQILSDPEAELTAFYSSTTTGSINSTYTTLYSLTGKSGRLDNLSIHISAGSDYYLKVTVDGVVVVESRSVINNYTHISAYKNFVNNEGSNVAVDLGAGTTGNYDVANLPNGFSGASRVGVIPYLPSLASAFSGTTGIMTPYGLYFKNSLLVEAKVSSGTANALFLMRGGYQ